MVMASLIWMAGDWFSPCFQPWCHPSAEIIGLFSDFAPRNQPPGTVETRVLYVARLFPFQPEDGCSQNDNELFLANCVIMKQNTFQLQQWTYKCFQFCSSYVRVFCLEGRKQPSVMRRSKRERIQKCWEFCPNLSSPLCWPCDKHKLDKKSCQKWLDMCRYSVNSVPGADINVTGGEIMSFAKRLLQIVTVSWVSVALRVLFSCSSSWF